MLIWNPRKSGCGKSADGPPEAGRWSRVVKSKLYGDLMDTIKPCPFCGGGAEACHTGVWWVKCCDPDCAAEGPPRDQKNACVEAWNAAPRSSGEAAEPSEWGFVENPPDQSSSDDDFYALTNGYIDPTEVLRDPAQIALVQSAEAVLVSFFEALREAGLREEM